jgi:hypothetical protein
MMPKVPRERGTPVELYQKCRGREARSGVRVSDEVRVSYVSTGVFVEVLI